MSKYFYEHTDEELYDLMNETMEIVYEQQLDKQLAKEAEEDGM